MLHKLNQGVTCAMHKSPVGLQVTHSVACLARWMAADLYLREVDVLRFEVRGGLQ